MEECSHVLDKPFSIRGCDLVKHAFSKCEKKGTIMGSVSTTVLKQDEHHYRYHASPDLQKHTEFVDLYFENRSEAFLTLWVKTLLDLVKFRVRISELYFLNEVILKFPNKKAFRLLPMVQHPKEYFPHALVLSVTYPINRLNTIWLFAQGRAA